MLNEISVPRLPSYHRQDRNLRPFLKGLISYAQVAVKSEQVTLKRFLPLHGIGDQADNPHFLDVSKIVWTRAAGNKFLDVRTLEGNTLRLQMPPQYGGNILLLMADIENMRNAIR